MRGSQKSKNRDLVDIKRRYRWERVEVGVYSSREKAESVRNQCQPLRNQRGNVLGVIYVDSDKVADDNFVQSLEGVLLRIKPLSDARQITTQLVTTDTTVRVVGNRDRLQLPSPGL